MAEKRASLIIELQDKASAALNSLEKSVQGMKDGWVGLAATVAAVAAEVYNSVTAFAAHEAATMRLGLAIKNAGGDSEGATKRLQELGDALSKTTGFSSSTITSMQGLLATMGFNEAAVAQMTPRVLDMSRAMGVDANTAALLLGKSIESGSNMSLKRMGLALDETAFKQHDFTRVLEEVDARVKGSAETYGGTAAGAIEKFKTALLELQEKIGQVLAEALLPLAKAFTESAEKALGFVGVLQIFIAGLEMSGTIISSTVRGLGSLAAVLALAMERDWKGAAAAAKTGMSQWLKEVSDGADQASKKIETAWDQIKAHMSGTQGAKKPAAGASPGPNQKPGGPISDVLDSDAVKKRIMELKGYHAEAQRLEMEHQAHMLDLANRGGEAQALRDAFYHKSMLKGSEDFFQNLSTLSTSKNKEMAMVGKAAATANTTIKTYESATEAYSAMAGIPVVGPVLGAAAAAAAIAAGIANVAQINSVNLAEGGMIMPTSGGTITRMGEAGKKELAIPLNDPKTKKAMAESGFGGVNVHLHGVVLLDPMGVRKLAETLDAEFFRMKRNRSSVAF